MLGTEERRTYLDALKPPQGYQLDQAIATTFSLDLLALLVVPLSLARFEVDDPAEAVSDPIILLETLRTHSERLTVFCQQGQIHVPPVNNLLLSYLEPVVFEARARKPDGNFHAKTWLLRFLESDGAKVLYRFLCLSKNLTLSRSWDTVFSIEGELTDRKRAFGKMNPLGDFYRALPQLAVGDLPQEKKAVLMRAQDEVRRTRFRMAAPFAEDAFRFWPLGVPGHLRSPFGGRNDRALVISPFLSSSFLTEFSEAGRGDILVSLPQSLAELGEKCLSRFGEVYVLDQNASEPRTAPPGVDAAETDPGEADGNTVVPSQGEELLGDLGDGLHAKIFAIKQGWESVLWTGSANATVAAMPHVGGFAGSVWGKNVEFLVEIRGKSSLIGIEKILGDPDQTGNLRGLLASYRPSEPPTEEELLRSGLEKDLDRLHRSLIECDFSLRILPLDASGEFDLELRGTTLPDLPQGFELRSWPVSQPPGKAVCLERAVLERGVVFPALSCVSLSRFMAFEIRGRREGAESVRRFVLNLPAVGLPEGRNAAVIRSILADRERFMRYLLLILGEDSVDSTIGFGVPGEARAGAKRTSWEALPLLEELVRAVSRAPEKIDRIERLLAELRDGDGAASVVPDGFDEIWEPVLEARKQLLSKVGDAGE